MPMSEFIGTPDVSVILRKKSWQYHTPHPDLDLCMTDFYHAFSKPDINIKNIFIIPEVGCAMVKPLWANRSCYVDSAVSPRYYYDATYNPNVEPDMIQDSQGRYRYHVEVPEGAQAETQEEIERRVFVSMPTLIQAVRGNPEFNAVVEYENADWKDINQAWDAEKEKREYNGPEFITTQLPPSGEGTKYTTSWISQISSAPNVEWFLLQKGNNFTNQSFWIDVFKHRKVDLNAEDKEDVNRYYRYGNREVRAFFAIRIGWNSPINGDFVDDWMVGNKDGIGPFDIVFPIDGTPFIWDHGIMYDEAQTIPEKDRTGKYVNYAGRVCGEINDDSSWILPDVGPGEYGNFQIYIYFMQGKLVIKTSFSNQSWFFPTNIEDIRKDIRPFYMNFAIPPGKVAFFGRGFSFRMSYNPLEFNIWENGKKKDLLHDGTNVAGLMYSPPLQERTSFNGQPGGWLDVWGYNKGIRSPYESGSFQNFFTIPNAYNDNMVSGVSASPSYGCDVVSSPYLVLGNNGQCGYTSMMIAVDGSDPYSDDFSPYSPSSILFTRMTDIGNDSVYSPRTTVQVRQDLGLTTVQKLDHANRIMQIGLRTRKPSMGPYTMGTSDRFASPIIWRIKGKHSVPDPPEGTDIDVTSLVENISYSSTAPDFFIIRQTYNVTFIIPKEPLIQDYIKRRSLPSFLNTRDKIIDLLQGGRREIEISVGWKNGSVSDPIGSERRVVFTGMTNSTPTENTFAMDRTIIECKDFMQILEDYPIINSPFYDGMAVSEAWMHLATLSGLPKKMFYVPYLSRARTEALDMGYSFDKPTLKFDNGTSLLDALIVITKRFWHVMVPSSYGKIVLSDLNQTGNREQMTEGQLTLIDNLPLSDDSFVFYMDGTDCNPFQRLYDKVSIDRAFNERSTSVEVTSVDRREQVIMVLNNYVDVEAIENPNAQDFLGYKKPFRIAEAAFGTREKTEFFAQLAAMHMYQSPTKVSFTTYGRPALRPFDIIALQMPEDGQNASFGVNNPVVDPSDLTRYIKLRVMGVSGEINLTSKMKYSMSIVAEHR
jgi:hypothetical protein